MKLNKKSSKIKLNSKLILNLTEIKDQELSKIRGGVNKFLTFTPAILYADNDHI